MQAGANDSQTSDPNLPYVRDGPQRWSGLLVEPITSVFSRADT